MIDGSPKSCVALTMSSQCHHSFSEKIAATIAARREFSKVNLPLRRTLLEWSTMLLFSRGSYNSVVRTTLWFVQLCPRYGLLSHVTAGPIQ